MANALLSRSSQLLGRATQTQSLSSSRCSAAAPVRARQLHILAATGQAAKTADGSELGSHNGSTSVSLSEGFKPFEEVKAEFAAIENAEIGLDGEENSLAREFYSTAVEKSVNEQINTHFNLFYAYNAMSSYFGRDNVALLGFGKMFRRFADQNYGHALVFQDFQAKRGGRVSLGPINAPQESFANGKGDAIYAAELALGFEKLQFRKLRELHAVTEEVDDSQAQDFVESRLTDQVQHVKIVADLVAELRRAGKGHGTWHYDRKIREGTIDIAAEYSTNITELQYR